MAARVVTEADVRANHSGAPIVVDARTAITPSALDLAFRLGIRVIWARSGETAPEESSSPRAGSAAVPVLHLPDGEYLVRVRAGRARVVRLPADGSAEHPVPTEGPP